MDASLACHRRRLPGAGMEDPASSQKLAPSRAALGTNRGSTAPHGSSRSRSVRRRALADPVHPTAIDALAPCGRRRWSMTSSAMARPDIHDRVSLAAHFQDAGRAEDSTGPRSAAAPLPGGRRRDHEATRAAWIDVARTALTSRAIDRIEEAELLPSGKLRNQFSARGHELVQSRGRVAPATPARRGDGLLPLAALPPRRGAHGARGVRRLARARDGAHPRARRGRRAQPAAAARRDGAADERRRRRPVHAGRRLGAGDRLPRDRARRGGVARARSPSPWAATPPSRRAASGRR